MSHYISSFFIDPVVRQARRFSRPSFSGEEAEESDQHASPTAPSTSTDGSRQMLAFRAPSFTLPTILASKDTISSTSLPTFPYENPLDPCDDTPLQLVEIENLEPAIAARQYIVRRALNNRQVPRIATLSRHQEDIAVPELSISEPAAMPLVEAQQPLQTLSHSMRDRLQEVLVEKPRRNQLAEDDGMGQMRQQILAIQQMDSSNEVKARLIYTVMTEKYNVSQQNSHARARSPASIQSSGRPYTPSSPKSMNSLPLSASPPTSSSSSGDGSNPFQLVPEDLKPTHWEKPQAEAVLGSRVAEVQDEPKALGCAHYKRNIKLQCSACNRWYTCRFCHDAVEDHMLNRRETRNMLCMLCGCAQPASKECVLCGCTAAWYYCNVCKLWDDDPCKEIYHCEDCGICRIGAGIGKSHLHCKVSSSLWDSDKILRGFRLVMCVWRLATLKGIDALKGLRSVTAPSVVNISSPLRMGSCSCRAGIASIEHVTAS